MNQIKRILENQTEVKYLCYFIQENGKTGKIIMYLSTLDISKKLVFNDENSCLNKLVDVLFDLKNLEKWALNRLREKK